MYNLLKRLASSYNFHLLSFTYSEEEQKYLSGLKDFCQTVDVVFQQEAIDQMPKWRAYLRYLRMLGTPEILAYMRNETMREKVTETLSLYPISLIQIEYTQMAQYLPVNCELPSILVELDVFFETLRRRIRLPNIPRKKILAFLEWLKMRRYELGILNKFTKIVTMSEHDRNLLLRENSGLDIVAIANGVDCQFFEYSFDASIKNSVLFVGNFKHFPNVDGLLYFAGVIWPRVKEAVPDAKLVIVGNAPTPGVKRLASEDVKVVGRVPDMRPYYAKAAVCVIPLRSGSGTRLKLLEALSCGVPVVATSVGGEGLDIEDGANSFIADTPAEFAEKAVRLLKDKELRLRFSQAGRKFVESKYSWDLIAEEQSKVYKELLRI